MKVLWITNILFPEAEQILTGSGELKASGGWILGAANALLEQSDMQLFVATVSSLVSELKVINGDNITYYVLPYGKGNLKINKDYEKYWIQVNDLIKPDIVHIHGTEFSHGYAFICACGVDNVVISIQGLKSAYYYYHYGMSKFDIFRNLTLRDILRGSIISGQRAFKKSSVYEVKMIQNAKHIIGRTSWDKARTWALNPDARYHFCNETLRNDFYEESKWEYEKCIKHSIFISQAGYPLKGLHQVLKAMPYILKHYPDTQIRIAGHDITKTLTIFDKLRLSGYGKYIKSLIKKYHLGDKITFVGNLNGEQMKQEYLTSNVFICPSSIENSPNSLGEAQILGTPTIASYVGGVMDMMKGNEENLYRFEEIEMLAMKVCDIFSHKGHQIDMVNIARDRHNKEKNVESLLKIYKNICNNTYQ